MTSADSPSSIQLASSPALTASSKSNEAAQIQPAPAWREHEPPGLMTTLGPLLSRRDGDTWVYGLRLDARHLNQAGLVHGGTFTALLDHAISTVAWEYSGKTPCLTVQLNTSFLRGAKSGQELSARARVTHGTGSMLFLDGSLYADDQLVATAQAIMKRLPKR